MYLKKTKITMARLLLASMLLLSAAPVAHAQEIQISSEEMPGDLAGSPVLRSLDEPLPASAMEAESMMAPSMAGGDEFAPSEPMANGQMMRIAKPGPLGVGGPSHLQSERHALHYYLEEGSGGYRGLHLDFGNDATSPRAVVTHRYTWQLHRAGDGVQQCQRCRGRCHHRHRSCGLRGDRTGAASLPTTSDERASSSSFSYSMFQNEDKVQIHRVGQWPNPETPLLPDVGCGLGRYDPERSQSETIIRNIIETDSYL